MPTLKELKIQAKEKGIKYFYYMRKDQLDFFYLKSNPTRLQRYHPILNF